MWRKGNDFQAKNSYPPQLFMLESLSWKILDTKEEVKLSIVWER